MLQEQLLKPEINETATVWAGDSASAISNEDALQIHVRIVDLLSNYTVSGVLLGFTPGEVSILVDEPLSEQREVAVWMNAFSFEGQTLYCRPNEARYEAHISIDDIQGAGLRKTPRFPVMIPAQLLAPGGDPLVITIVDLSRDGMGIDSPIHLKAGQPIAIVAGPAFVFAIVRHCQQTPEGTFRAGLEMHHVFGTPAIKPPQPSDHGALLKRWKAKLFSIRVRGRSECHSELHRLGSTEVAP